MNHHNHKQRVHHRSISEHNQKRSPIITHINLMYKYKYIKDEWPALQLLTAKVPPLQSKRNSDAGEELSRQLPLTTTKRFVRGPKIRSYRNICDWHISVADD